MWMCRFHSPDGFVLAASSRTGFRISLFAPMPFLPMPMPISSKAGGGNLLGSANAHRENEADKGHSDARARDVRALPFLDPQPSFTCGKSEERGLPASGLSSIHLLRGAGSDGRWGTHKFRRVFIRWFCRESTLHLNRRSASSSTCSITSPCPLRRGQVSSHSAAPS